MIVMYALTVVDVGCVLFMVGLALWDAITNRF
jgi:hypothetical protein